MSNLEAALRITQEQGWSVFPCVSLPGQEGDKKPLTPHGFKDATKDEKQIRKWWQRWPNAMIGVPMGAASGVWAVDLDVPEKEGDADGVANWQELRATVAPDGLPQTREHHTPSGGRHLLFRWRPEYPVTNKKGGLPAGIDVRGEGGYIIVPPSRTADGREYKSNGCGEIADAPGWLYDFYVLPLGDSELRRWIEEDIRGTGGQPPAGEQSNFRKINDAAMANLSAWVLHLFPEARPYKDGYRVSSKDLKRDLEEDISILPIGIVDWGVHDMGDARGGKRTPIDLVVEWGKKNPHAAAAWLAERLGIQPRQPTGDKPAAGDKHDDTISAEELMRMEFPPVQFIVPGYVVEGLTVFGGKPKVGKSWWAYDVCIAVAVGGMAMGAIECEQGDVLYLCLEDNRRRVKNRINVVRPYSDRLGGLERLSIRTRAPRVDEGLLKEIEKWRIKAEKPRLVVIDVWIRVRPPRQRGADLYAADYAAAEPLQRYATQHRLGLIIVTHTRKMEANDPLESISGTNGITGAADSVLVLTRSADGSKIYGRGRDMADVETALAFNAGRWTILGSVEEVHRSEQRKKILSALEEAGRPLSPKEISDLTQIKSVNIRMMLLRMGRDGEVVGENGRYRTAPKQADLLG